MDVLKSVIASDRGGEDPRELCLHAPSFRISSQIPSSTAGWELSGGFLQHFVLFN